MIPVISCLVIYVAASIFITNKLNDDYQKALLAEADTKQQIELVKSDIEKINQKTDDYNKMIQNFETQTERIRKNTAAKQAIPKLLKKLSKVIPKEVRIMSIENTEDDHIQIIANSPDYDKLGIFLAKLKLTKGDDTILKNVISNSAIRENKHVVVVIEGDLP